MSQDPDRTPIASVLKLARSLFQLARCFSWLQMPRGALTMRGKKLISEWAYRDSSDDDCEPYLVERWTDDEEWLEDELDKNISASIEMQEDHADEVVKGESLMLQDAFENAARFAEHEDDRLEASLSAFDLVVKQELPPEADTPPLDETYEPAAMSSDVEVMDDPLPGVCGPSYGVITINYFTDGARTPGADAADSPPMTQPSPPSPPSPYADFPREVGLILHDARRSQTDDGADRREVSPTQPVDLEVTAQLDDAPVVARCVLAASIVPEGARMPPGLNQARLHADVPLQVLDLRRRPPPGHGGRPGPRRPKARLSGRAGLGMQWTPARIKEDPRGWYLNLQTLAWSRTSSTLVSTYLGDVCWTILLVRVFYLAMFPHLRQTNEDWDDARPLVAAKRARRVR